MSVNFSAFKTNKILSSVATAVDSHTSARAPLSIATSPISVAVVTTATRQQQQQQQQQHPITTTKMGSRRIFSAQFKLQVLDSYRNDSDCKGNQRATARKYGIHRRQIQKWLQGESNLRSSIILNNNNNNNNNSNSNNNNTSSANNANNSSINQNNNVKIVTPNGNKRLHENCNATKSIISQKTITKVPLVEISMPLDASNGFAAYNQTSHHVERAPVAVSFASTLPAPPPHALDSSSAISPAFTPYMRRPIELTSPSHYHDLPLIPASIAAAAYDNVFHHHHHHHPSAAYPFYDYHHHMYAGIPAYLTMPPALPAVQSQGIVPITIRPQSLAENPTENNLPHTNSPIDLSLPMQRPSNSPTRIAKPRPFLPLSMPNDIKVEKVADTCSSGNASGSGIDEHKPWDLSRKRHRHTDEQSDEDEGISVVVSVKTSPTPAKVVKLFKPYLLSSDDEDDDAGKKCLPSDATATKLPQTQQLFFDNAPAVKVEAVSASATTPIAASSSASYWLNHGSPVSGYDSASSTFSSCSDCNCNDPMCATKLSSPAPTTYSDDFNSTNANDEHRSNNHNTSIANTTAATKYMVPRRHILEKWSHEEDDAYAHQYALNYHM